jgi:hypothetical protein
LFCFLTLPAFCFEQKFFEELQDRENEFGISDIQLGLTTLEEVFLNIAKQAELESAAAEGRLATLTLTSSGASVSVSGIYFFIYCILGITNA